MFTDIDECADNVDNCTQLQECVNTAGSFTCSCITGYQDSSTSLSLCEGKHYLSTGINAGVKTCVCGSTDIDECAVESDNCHQDCINTNGSFSCSCWPGFELNPDNTTCNGNYEFSVKLC